MATAVVMLCLCSSITHKRRMMKYKREIVKFEAQHKPLFTAPVILPIGKQTFEAHQQNVMKPMVRASQIELQAAVELYSVPLYLHTQTSEKYGYHWLYYEQKTSLAPIVKHHHIELAHPASVHFDLTVDAPQGSQARFPLN